MKVRILNHYEVHKGTKKVDVENIFTAARQTLVLNGQSYTNFVKYIMYLWGGDHRSTDVVTKVVDRGGCYCFFKA